MEDHVLSKFQNLQLCFPTHNCAGDSISDHIVPHHELGEWPQRLLLPRNLGIYTPNIRHAHALLHEERASMAIYLSTVFELRFVDYAFEYSSRDDRRIHA